jgi:hypothetical protein
MLFLFLRTFKYIFSYFSPFKNECVSKCAQRSFSTWHFPSVDEWLSMSHRLCHTPSCPPFHNQLALLFDGRLSVSQVPEGVSVQREGLGDVRLMQELHNGELFLQEHHVSNRIACQWRHHQMADVVCQWSVWACHINIDFQDHNAIPDNDNDPPPAAFTNDSDCSPPSPPADNNGYTCPLPTKCLMLTPAKAYHKE